MTWREVRRWPLVAMLGLAVALSAAPAAGSLPHTAQPARSPYDVEAIRAELAVDGVAVHRSGVDRQALVRVVADARHAGLQLSVVVLLRDPPTGDMRELVQLAEELRSGADTVLVMTPSWSAAASGELSPNRLERAVDAIETPDEAAAAQEFADDALRTGAPWLMPALAGVALTVVALLVGFGWGRRRRRQTDSVTLEKINDRLGEELSDLGAAVVYLESLVAAGDPATQRQYAELRTAYRQVREEAEQLLHFQRHADQIGSRLTAVRTSLDQLRAMLEAGPKSPSHT